MKTVAKLALCLAVASALLADDNSSAAPGGAGDPSPALIQVPAGTFIASSNRDEREAAYRLD